MFESATLELFDEMSRSSNLNLLLIVRKIAIIIPLSVLSYLGFVSSPFPGHFTSCARKCLERKTRRSCFVCLFCGESTLKIMPFWCCEKAFWAGDHLVGFQKKTFNLKVPQIKTMKFALKLFLRYWASWEQIYEQIYEQIVSNW